MQRYLSSPPSFCPAIIVVGKARKVGKVGKVGERGEGESGGEKGAQVGITKHLNPLQAFGYARKTLAINCPYKLEYRNP